MAVASDRSPSCDQPCYGHQTLLDCLRRSDTFLLFLDSQSAAMERRPSLSSPIAKSPSTACHSVDFMTICTTCGRRLNVAVTHLGGQVQCPHCGRHFYAVTAPANNRVVHDPLIARADAILARLTAKNWNGDCKSTVMTGYATFADASS
jgi:hypothetical protein